MADDSHCKRNPSALRYTLAMPDLSPAQKQKISQKLIALDSAQLDTLKEESITTIKSVLSCSDDEAATVLKSFEDQKLIQAKMTPGGALDTPKPMPVARWRWDPSTTF
jgi:hypothetical protein